MKRQRFFYRRGAETAEGLKCFSLRPCVFGFALSLEFQPFSRQFPHFRAPLLIDVQELSAEGAAPYQPGATPQVRPLPGNVFSVFEG